MSSRRVGLQCVLCASHVSKRLWIVNGYDVVRCSNCGLVFVSPQPSDIELNDFYTRGYFSGGEQRSDGYADYDGHDDLGSPRGRKNIAHNNLMLDEIERLTGVGRMLEVGGAFGLFLIQANERGWECLGVEKSSYCCNIMIERGLDTFNGDISDAGLEDGSFDAVFCNMAIEHFLDPVGLVAECSRVLRPGGVAVIRTVDIGSVNARLNNFAHRFFGRPLWSEIKPPEHLFYFSKKTLSHLMHRYELITHFLPEFEGKSYANASFRNPVLRIASVMLKPVLRRIPAGSDMAIMGIRTCVRAE